MYIEMEVTVGHGYYFHDLNLDSAVIVSEVAHLRALRSGFMTRKYSKDSLTYRSMLRATFWCLLYILRMSITVVILIVRSAPSDDGPEVFASFTTSEYL